MATVWRFRRGFTSVFSLLVCSQRWSQITDTTKKKYTIFKRSWKYLIGKKCLFLWTICVHRTSLYLMRVGASYIFQNVWHPWTLFFSGLLTFRKNILGKEKRKRPKKNFFWTPFGFEPATPGFFCFLVLYKIPLTVVSGLEMSVISGDEDAKSSHVSTIWVSAKS